MIWNSDFLFSDFWWKYDVIHDLIGLEIIFGFKKGLKMDILECSSYVLIKESMGIEFSSSKYNVELPEHIKRFLLNLTSVVSLQHWSIRVVRRSFDSSYDNGV